MYKKIGIILCIFILNAFQCFAAGTCSVTANIGTSSGEIVIQCTADASNGSVPNASFSDCSNFNNLIPFLKGQKPKGTSNWYITSVTVIPGSTGPTDNSDFVLNNSDSRDILGGAGTDMIDNTSKRQFYPENSEGDYKYQPVTSDLTQVVTNNSVNSASFTIKYQIDQ